MAAIFGRFSRNSRTVLESAHKIATQLGRSVQSDVVLLSIFEQGSSPAAEVLRSLGLEQKQLVEYILTTTAPPQPERGLTAEMSNLLEESIKLASRYRFIAVETEHLLYTMARGEHYTAHTALQALGLSPRLIVNRLGEWMQSISLLSQNSTGEQELEGRDSREGRGELDRFVTDLTELASRNLLDPVIGREEEIEQMVHILLRRRKSNPLLLGEPGVGKTALVDGLAQRITKHTVPQALSNKRVLTLDLGLVVAGTMYRGQFEERLKGIIQEIQAMGDCILFIDEIHTLSGTGSAEGGFDAANILKPALARGEITVIGATTYEEYRKHILKDKALERRFQTITVGEPSPKETLQMLKGLRRDLENHHRVMITEEAMQAAVELSQRYIHDRFLPDKAIDVLDQAATLHAEAYSEEAGDVSSLQLQLTELALKKREIIFEAETESDYAYAKSLSVEETTLLQKLQKAQREQGKHKVHKPITAAHIARVIADRTKVPLSDIQQSLEPLSMGRVREVLAQHILGQPEAVTEISQALLRAQLGLNEAKKPLGAFLLVGPTGVGKTETARVLAKEVFGDSKALIKIDMSEYMERHAVSNLVGAPAGYVGFEQGGSLTEQVRRRPYSVILFDEVEKAHPDVFNVLLQILEDGELTDNTGNTISFAHTLVIMTSNIGMQQFSQLARIGFQTKIDHPETQQRELRAHIERELKDFFRPELLGRLSSVIFYRALDASVVKKLFSRQLSQLKKRLRSKGVTVVTTPAVTTWLTTLYIPEAGARSIDRAFLQKVEPPILQALADTPGAHVLSLDIKEAALVVTASDIPSETTP